MELDLGQVRAFVVTAEQLHFGRAAARLFLTQQALSKRIRQLERTLGEPLFVRGTRGVELSGAGHRFLPHARQLLDAADAAAQAAQPASWPLRVDVWGHVQAPVRIVRRLIDQTPELLIQLSMRRSLPAALEALEHGEIDACFGRVQDLGQPWPARLTHRPVLLERLAVAVGAEDPLADPSLLRPPDLRQWILWVPAAGSSPEVLGGYQRFADQFGIPMDTSGQNLGLEGVIGQLRSRPGRFTLLGIDWPIPTQAGITLIRLDPAPCCLWSLVWRQDHQHSLLEVLLDRALRTGQTEGWLAYDPQHDWLPTST